MANPRESAVIFEKHRPVLMGIAYRFLGSVSDAEDIVQDVYLKWSSVERADIDQPEAWLKKVCTRKCLDVTKSIERTRVNYIGTWLPEPLLMDEASVPDAFEQLVLSESLTTAFLLALERLSPKERAAYLLHTVFDSPYSYVSRVLHIEESACRKLVSRAKKNIESDRVRSPVSPDQANVFLSSFEQAVVEGDQSRLETLLVKDVVLRADGGGKVPALMKDVVGIDAVVRFLSTKLRRYWESCVWLKTRINGNPGLIIKENKKVHAVVSFEFNQSGEVRDIFIVRNPDKINVLNVSPIM